jgi:hypothetical protein
MLALNFRTPDGSVDVDLLVGEATGSTSSETAPLW